MGLDVGLWVGEATPALPQAHHTASLISVRLGSPWECCFGGSTFANMGCQDTTAEGEKSFQEDPGSPFNPLSPASSQLLNHSTLHLASKKESGAGEHLCGDLSSSIAWLQQPAHH